MTQVVIFNQDNGTPAVIFPTQEAIDKYGIMAIAVKDVPFNKPFKILNATDLPIASQETWVVNDLDLTDGFGGESNFFEVKV